MPFEIVRNDITQMRVDAIVNTANPRPVIGSGVDAGIHRAAGPELLTVREKIGRIGVGEAAITPGFGLNAKYVIHTVGPVWRGGLLGERKLLRGCYESSLSLALENGCTSIAFPLISTGNYGFPKDEALRIALDAIRGFLNDHEMMISLVVFDRESFQLSRQRYREVASFIDDNYIQKKLHSRFLPAMPVGKGFAGSGWKISRRAHRHQCPWRLLRKPVLPTCWRRPTRAFLRRC